MSSPAPTYHASPGAGEPGTGNPRERVRVRPRAAHHSRVVVDGRLLHYNRAGIGRYVRHLYRALAGLAPPGGCAALDVTVLYARNDGKRRLRAAWPKGRSAWTPAHHRLERWTLALEVARLRPALFHAPDHVCPQPLGWRTVLTVHDLAFRRLPETHAPASRAYYAGLERSLRQATRVICVSEATHADLLALAGADPSKVRVVYEAPDPAYTPDGPAAAAPRPYFLFVGTLEPRKNVAGLLRALATLPPAGRPELRLVGAAGAGADGLAAAARALGVERDVRFLGRRPTAEVAALYRGALALVYPSLLEGFGLPILEAMASGTPVITSERSSMAEIAGGAAELVDPDDPAALAGAMAHLAHDPCRREALRRRGLDHVRRFSLERAARETLAVVDEALQA
jgi:glycosyltransferase involved in cell wall biosynthesis